MAKRVFNMQAIARELAHKHNITIKAANHIVKDVFGIIGNNLDTNTDMYLHVFGSFKISDRRYQQPGTDIIGTSNVVTFKAFKATKQKVN